MRRLLLAHQTNPTVLLLAVLTLLCTSVDSRACSKGCLKCLSTGVCVICDIPSGYSRVSGICIKNSVENCKTRDFNGDCLTCITQYYLDLGKCIYVEEPLKECDEYFTVKSCQKCKVNNYLKEGQCEPVKEMIDNCILYNNDASKCLECNSNFFLSLDNKKCEVPPTTHLNCLSYNQIGCKSCKTGYQVNMNKYIYDSADLDSITGKRNGSISITSQTTGELTTLLEKFWNLIIKDSKNNDLKYCIRQIVANCSEFVDFDKCSKCNDTYILTENFECVKYPEPMIEFCDEYTSTQNCKKCANAYYLVASQTKCAKSIDIVKCKTYSSSVANTCIECEEDFFVNGGACKSRTLQNISKCVSLYINKDSCSKCDLGYVPNNTAQKCLIGVTNCNGYSKLADSVTCTSCSAGFYLSGAAKCEKGNLNGCLNYSSQTECLECTQGFYLKGGQCEAHSQKDVILNCLQFSTKNLNKCEGCDNTAVSYFMSGFCMAVNTIVSGCKKYSDQNTCETCFTNQSYLNGNECTLGTIPNCENYEDDKNQCNKCKIDFENKNSYVAFPQKVNNKCYLGNKNVHYNCREFNTQGDLENCTVCETNHYLYSHVSNKIAFCVPRDYYKLFANKTDGTLSVDQTKLSFCELWDSETRVCKRCKIKKVIDTTGKCVDECTAGQRLLTFQFNKEFNDEFYIDKYFSCTEDSEAYKVSTFKNTYRKCYRFDEVTKNEEFCMECDKSGIGVVDFDSNKSGNDMITSKLRYISSKLINNISVFNRITPVSECVSRTTSLTQATTENITKVVTIDGTIGSDFNNCRFVMKIGTDSFGCVGCDFGFSGEVVQDKDKGGNFIKNCLAVSGCNSSTFYSGLGSLPKQADRSLLRFPLDFFASCHSCTNEQIPTISILRNQKESSPTESKGISKFIYPFGYATNANSNTGIQSGTNGQVTSCQTNMMGNLAFNFCGLQEYSIDMAIVSVSVTGGAVNGTANPVCLACKPGYKATMSVTVGMEYVIAKCDIIPNCNTSLSHTFNRCDKCVGTFSLKYDATAQNKLTKGEECVDSGTENCLVYDVDSSKCVRCQTSYVLNADFVCDSVDGYGCEEYGYFTKDIEQVAEHYSFTGHGCIKCSGDLIASRFPGILTTCVSSQSLQPGSGSASSFLIGNCTYYGINEKNEIICAQCNSISISSVSKKKCFVKPNTLNNCLYVSNDSKENQISCAICENSFFKDDFNYCLKGDILNCVEYESQLKCKTCLNGYLKTQIQSGAIVCILPNAEFCSVYDPSSALIGNLKCTLCNTNYFFTQDSALGTFPLTSCLKIPTISNCVKYNNSGGILASSLKCIECTASYYIDSKGMCAERKKQAILNCLEKDISADKCGNCSVGFFVNSDGDCQAYPTGVINCLIYENAKECSRCDKGYFVTENKCVLAGKPIRDCYYYRTETFCDECRPGFYYDGTDCVLADAINCKTYKNKSECDSCEIGFGIIKDNNVLSCIEISINNCSVPDYTSIGPDFKCKQCNVGFYLNQTSGCTAVPEQIEFCGIYDTSETCALCFNNYVLLSNRKKCVISTSIENYIDQNCLNSFFVSEMVCNVCMPGYYFEIDDDVKLKTNAASQNPKDDTGSKTVTPAARADSGQSRMLLNDPAFKSGLLIDEFENSIKKGCIQCPVTNGIKSCALCYPKTPEFCLICNSGFTHDSDGTCSLTDQDTSKTPDTASETRFGVVLVFSILALVFSDA